MQKCLTFSKLYYIEDIKEHNPDWPKIPDHYQY